MDPQESWGPGTGPLWKHAPTFHTHTFSLPCILPSTAQGPRDLRHIAIDLKNKRKSYTSIFHSLKKCFKKLCTGVGGWEPCPGSGGRRAAVSQPAPWFRPWSCCLLIFMFLKANTLRRHARTHARTPTNSARLETCPETLTCPQEHCSLGMTSWAEGTHRGRAGWG